MTPIFALRHFLHCNVIMTLTCITQMQ
jgi:hypothetical protein